MKRRQIWPGLAIVAVLGVIGVIIWAAVAGGPASPPGQHEELWYFQPIIVGKVTSLMPVYHCVAGAP